MRTGRQVSVLERILDVSSLEELFAGSQKERLAARWVLAAVAAGEAGATRRAVLNVARARGVTPQYVVDRVMVFIAGIAELRERDLYEILGVTPVSTPDDIQRRWRQLAKRFHPDVAANPGNVAEFRRLHDAYQTLRDPERRVRYEACQLRAGGMVIRESAATARDRTVLVQRWRGKISAIIASASLLLHRLRGIPVSVWRNILPVLRQGASLVRTGFTVVLCWAGCTAGRIVDGVRLAGYGLTRCTAGVAGVVKPFGEAAVARGGATFHFPRGSSWGQIGRSGLVLAVVAVGLVMMLRDDELATDRDVLPTHNSTPGGLMTVPEKDLATKTTASRESEIWEEFGSEEAALPRYASVERGDLAATNSVTRDAATGPSSGAQTSAVLTTQGEYGIEGSEPGLAVLGTNPSETFAELLAPEQRLAGGNESKLVGAGEAPSGRPSDLAVPLEDLIGGKEPGLTRVGTNGTPDVTGEAAVQVEIAQDEAARLVETFREYYEHRRLSELVGLFVDDAVENARVGRHAIDAAYRAALGPLRDVRYKLGSLDFEQVEGGGMRVRSPFTIMYARSGGAQTVSGIAAWDIVRDGGALRIGRLSYELER